MTLGVTCSVTCTEVLVLELHFRSQAGEPTSPRLVRLARWMAAVTLTRLDISVKENTGVTWTLVSQGTRTGNQLKLSQKSKLSSTDQWFDRKRAELKKQQQKVLRLKMEGFDVTDYKMGITGRS